MRCAATFLSEDWPKKDFLGLLLIFLRGMELCVTYTIVKISRMCVLASLLTQYLNNNLSGPGTVIKIYEYYLLPGAQS